MQAESDLLDWSFELDQLLSRCPMWEYLCLTTKGLYATRHYLQAVAKHLERYIRSAWSTWITRTVRQQR